VNMVATLGKKQAFHQGVNSFHVLRVAGQRVRDRPCKDDTTSTLCGKTSSLDLTLVNHGIVVWKILPGKWISTVEFPWGNIFCHANVLFDISHNPFYLQLLHEIFATRLFRDFGVHIFRDP